MIIQITNEEIRTRARYFAKNAYIIMGDTLSLPDDIQHTIGIWIETGSIPGEQPYALTVSWIECGTCRSEQCKGHNMFHTPMEMQKAIDNFTYWYKRSIATDILTITLSIGNLVLCQATRTRSLEPYIITGKHL